VAVKYRWLLLDADGTLFDYDRAEAVALARTFEAFGHPFQAEHATTYRQINAQIWLDYERGQISAERLRVQRFELLAETTGARFDASTFSDRYLAHLAECSYLMENAEDMVRRLHGRVSMVILTNGLREVQRRRLAGSSIEPFVTDIVVSGEVGAAKPAPEIFDAAFEVMDHPEKKDVLMVGDGLTADIAGGQAYGIDTCWFNPQGKPSRLKIEPDYEIRSLTELLDIVQGV